MNVCFKLYIIYYNIYIYIILPAICFYIRNRTAASTPTGRLL